MPPATVFRTALTGLEKIHEGKVRDIYAVDAESMLIVTTDRLSAFDVVLPDPIPNKGRVLHQISDFWFGRTRHIETGAASPLPDRIMSRPSDLDNPSLGKLLRGRDKPASGPRVCSPVRWRSRPEPAPAAVLLPRASAPDWRDRRGRQAC